MSAVFFDMDGTLINGDTNDQTTRFYLDRKLATADFTAPLPAYVRSFFAGKLNITEFIEYIVSPLLPLDAKAQQEFLTALVTERILPLVKRGAYEAIEFHLKRQDTLVIVTSTVDYLVRHIARALGIAHVIAAPIGTDEQGRITGKVVGVVPYQHGKVERIEQFLKAQQLSWEDSYAYGDTVNDLPMLLKATHRFAIDPNAQLCAHPDFVRLQTLSWL